jgi:anti-anti-sigma regulatory factor
MLRITQSKTGIEQRWTLCGRLSGPWVAELRTCWERGRQVSGGANTLVDLSDVTFIDESGEKLLSEMRSAGAEFVAAGVATKHLVEHLKDQRGPGRRSC